MVEPLTLTTVSTVILTEGIKFLYGQATEALKAWRGRQQRRQDTTAPTPLPVSTNALEGKLDTSRLDMERMPALESRLNDLRRDVSYWAEGIEPVDVSNSERLARVDELRRVLEAVYSQRITFKGETRPPSGTPIVEGVVEVNGVTGLVAGVQTDDLPTGRVHGGVRAGRVEPGGQAFGVRIGGGHRDGSSPPASSKSSGTESDEK